jgi:peptidoglycan hydrolase CwlO-like protein
MKKIILLLLVLLSIASVGYLVVEWTICSDNEMNIKEKEDQIKKIETELSDKKKAVEEANKRLEEVKEQNKDKIEELEKWQKEAKKVEDLL